MSPFTRFKNWYDKTTREHDRMMFLRSFDSLSPIDVEEELKDFVAKNFQGLHVSRNPVSRKVTINNPPFA